MYIVFDFPDDDRFVIGAFNHMLNQALHDWSDQYNIPYNTKIYKLTRRITFDHEENYSFFAMTWTGPEYKLVEPMKVDRS